MFATKGQLKVSLLVVGILVVGLGMYAALQHEEAEAIHSSISCLAKEHDILPSSSTTVTGSSYTGQTRRTSTYCFSCYACPKPRSHKQKRKIIYFDYRIDYDHRYPFGSWSFCHTHFGSSSREQWVTETCGLKCT